MKDAMEICRNGSIRYRGSQREKSDVGMRSVDYHHPRGYIFLMRIGLLTDTHLPGAIRELDELGPEPANFFSNVDLILHGGDLTSPMVLDWLEQFAPVICATGNNDPMPDPRTKEIQTLDVHGWSIGLVNSILGIGSASNPEQYLVDKVVTRLKGGQVAEYEVQLTAVPK